MPPKNHHAPSEEEDTSSGEYEEIIEEVTETEETEADEETDEEEVAEKPAPSAPSAAASKPPLAVSIQREASPQPQIPPSDLVAVVPELSSEEDESGSYEDETEEEIEEIEEIEEYEEVEEVEEETRQDPVKYFTFPVEELQEKQQITHVHTTNKFIYVGTNEGTVIVVNLEGSPYKTYTVGQFGINDITSDGKGDFFAAADNKGLLLVQNLCDDNDCFRKDFPSSIRCLAIHHEYDNLDEKPLMLGFKDCLMLSTKSRFIGRSFKKIEERGHVHTIAWCKNLVAYACDQTIKLFDYNAKAIFKLANKPDTCVRSFSHCSLFWESDSSLLVGWGDWISNLCIERRTSEYSARERDSFITSHNPSNPYRVSGIAPLSAEEYILLVCVLKSNADEGKVEGVEVRVMRRSTSETTYTGKLDIGNRHPFLYRMSHCTQDIPTADREYFIMAPDGIIKIVPSDTDDFVDFLVDKKRMQEAFDIGRRKQLKRIKLSDLGTILMGHLIENQEWGKAARQMREVYGTSDESAPQWEQCIKTFDKAGKAYLLAEYLPKMVNKVRTGGPKLSEDMYVMVLNACLHHDLNMFTTYIDAFAGLYKYAPITTVTSMKFSTISHNMEKGLIVNAWVMHKLGMALAKLYGYQGDHENAVEVLMGVSIEDVFQYIRDHGLFAKAAQMLPQLFTKSKEDTLNLLMEHTGKNEHASPLAPEEVLKVLDKHKKYMWCYVEHLNTPRHQGILMDLSTRHAQMFAQLYVDYDNKRLLPFLHATIAHIPNPKAILDLCKANNLVEEQAFLMTRMGSKDEGLKLLVEGLKNVKKAIDLIKEFPSDKDQKELFERLVSLVKKVQSTQLLVQDGFHYIEHKVKKSDTWVSIAERYGADFEELRQTNSTIEGREEPEAAVVRVPLNMIANLLKEVADPAVTESTAIDPAYLINELPPDVRIPNIGQHLWNVSASKSRYKSLMEILLSILSADLSKMIRSRSRQRSKAIRINSHGGSAPHICSYCSTACVGMDMIIFRCGHVYHPKCSVDYLFQKEVVKPDWVLPPDHITGHGVGVVQDGKIINPMAFLNNPRAYLKYPPKVTIPHCYLCPPGEDTGEDLVDKIGR